MILITITMLGIAMLAFYRLGWKRESNLCCVLLVICAIGAMLGYR